MVKQEIIEKICKYFKLTQFEAEKIYDDIFSGIINGVKEDNIADVTNLGEFIIKYNNGDGNKSKTVEFLPTLSLEEEINQRSFEEQRSFEPPPYVNPLEMAEDKSGENTIVNEKPEVIQDTKAAGEKMQKHDNNITENTEEKNISERPVLSDVPDTLSVEDEIKRKREEILQKITSPASEQDKKSEIPVEKRTADITPVFPPAVTDVFSASEKTVKDISEKEKTESVTENTIKSTELQAVEIVNKAEEKITDKQKETQETVSDSIDEIKKEVPETREKSFSDYFTEISDSEKSASESGGKSVKPPVENVIPPSAVELHNELTGEQKKPEGYQTSVNPLPYNGNGNGNNSGSGDNTEHRLSDNSYYIWYKDSEPNVSDTQTMSYEYELLYQATKEAEYKSKLRIYVTTFILFFSIVLILLIFSPVIYKYFFTPSETDQNTEEVQDESGLNGSTQQDPSSQNQASLNSLPENNTNPENTSPPVNNNTQSSDPSITTQNVEQPKQETAQQEAPKQEAPKQETPKQEVPKTEAPVQPNTTSPPAGITKNSMGWMDDVNKVIYVQLENGKFTIQESAWDSDSKAKKRLSVVAGIVPGLKGSVLKADLGSKGTWYRARFGEFSTIEEARTKAAELRNKEQMKLQALLLTVFLYA